MDGAAASHVLFGLNPIPVSTLLLAVVYAIVITDKINRSIVALLGAGLMVLTGVVDQAEALRGVDWNAIGLLTGMMILVSIARRSGLFEFAAIWSAQAARANPAGILLLLQVATAVTSALLDNVTTVLLIVPVTLAITREMKIAPYPFLFAEIFASNIGGTATLIGDPPNIMIGSGAGLDFNAFLVNLGPIIAVVFLVQAALVHLVWGRSLRCHASDKAQVMAMDPRAAILDWLLLKQSLAVIGCVVVAFVLARPIHLEPASIAMLGAATLMLFDNLAHQKEAASKNIHRTFGDVEWITIFFFIGLFIVVHGVEASGLLALLAGKLVAATGGSLPATGLSILWASAFLSSILDNIPFVATMIPLIKSTGPALGGPQQIEPLWWCLSLGACLGGNGTLIGASANLTVAGIGDRNGVPFRFLTYLRWGFPMMLVSIAICHAYVWLRYF